MISCGFVFFYTVFLFILECSGHKILFLAMPQSPSHMGSMYPLANALVENGHDVSFFSEVNEKFKKPLPKGVTGRFPILKYPDPDNDVSITGKKDNSSTNPMFVKFLWEIDMSSIGMFFPWNISSSSTGSLLAHQPEEFWKVAKENWDLIVVDSLFTPMGAAFAANTDAPHVLLHTTFLEGYIADMKGLPHSPHIRPPMFADPKRKWHVKRFWSRIESVWEAWLTKYILGFVINWIGSSAIYPVAKNTGPLRFFRESQASFVESQSRIDWPSSWGHDTFYTGCHCNLKPKSLPGDLKSFMDDPKSKGTILVAFGTMGDWTTAPAHIFDKFFAGLAALKEYRIIWQYTGDGSAFPPHIKTMKWLPQTDILLHPKTKLFVSHGGLKSFKETICAGVPVLYFPLFAEQIRAQKCNDGAG